MLDLKIARSWTPPIHPEECVSGSNPGQTLSITNIVSHLNFVTFSSTFTFSQSTFSTVTQTYFPCSFSIFSWCSFGIIIILNFPWRDIFAINFSIFITNPCTYLKNRHGQPYLAMYIYLTMAEYILDSHSNHKKGGG